MGYKPSFGCDTFCPAVELPNRRQSSDRRDSSFAVGARSSVPTPRNAPPSTACPLSIRDTWGSHRGRGWWIVEREGGAEEYEGPAPPQHKRKSDIAKTRAAPLPNPHHSTPSRRLPSPRYLGVNKTKVLQAQQRCTRRSQKVEDTTSRWEGKSAVGIIVREVSDAPSPRAAHQHEQREPQEPPHAQKRCQQELPTGGTGPEDRPEFCDDGPLVVPRPQCKTSEGGDVPQQESI